MPLNKNALIRYKTIDKCLQNKYKKWTLEDLIESCSDALYEFEGIYKEIGKRTIQADIQFMRSDKLGYNAPIIVFDRKYYTYEDPNYSITNIPVTDVDMGKLSEAVEVLKQFKNFSHFTDLLGIIQKLEDKIYSEKTKLQPIIDFDKNENLRGLEFLDTIYKAILNKKVVNISYKSFKAKNKNDIQLHPYLLKEYRNRWFVLGRKSKTEPLVNFALDRIISLEILLDEFYIENENFNPTEYFKNVIGVSVKPNKKVEIIHLSVNNEIAPYILTKPLHHSQKIVSNSKTNTEITIEVIPNLELEKEILSFGENVTVISPEKFRKQIKKRITDAKLNYKKSI